MVPETFFYSLQLFLSLKIIGPLVVESLSELSQNALEVFFSVYGRFRVFENCFCWNFGTHFAHNFILESGFSKTVRLVHNDRWCAM